MRLVVWVLKLTSIEGGHAMEAQWSSPEVPAISALSPCSWHGGRPRSLSPKRRTGYYTPILFTLRNVVSTPKCQRDVLALPQDVLIILALQGLVIPTLVPYGMCYTASSKVKGLRLDALQEEKVTPFVSCPVAVCALSCPELF